ncbi:MAG: hypothetical protein KJZ85_04340 [Rhodobacteraceae bacterium]|jgi:cytochrome c|nr:hypothetical protein [Paracoccaceae bacterium]
MRVAGYLFAVASAAAIGAAIFWANGTERAGAVTHLAVQDGWRFSTAAPSGHGALARCVACHRVEAAGPERSAPALTGVVGAPVARAGWFGYSPALRRHGGVWSRARLEAYLADPTGTVPGTFKTLSPIRDAAERSAILDALGRI